MFDVRGLFAITVLFVIRYMRQKLLKNLWIKLMELVLRVLLIIKSTRTSMAKDSQIDHFIVEDLTETFANLYQIFLSNTH
jgi:hypothetical protein